MRIAFITVTALILLGTGAAAAQEISNDYNKADFAHFKTYAWASGHSVADESLNQSIVRSIDGQLSAKGLTKVSPGEHPDVYWSPTTLSSTATFAAWVSGTVCGTCVGGAVLSMFLWACL
jgi:hypothetical protein